jgi:hypothetical protein
MRNIGLFLGFSLILGAAPALADSIDGDWCAPDGGISLSIHGSTIRTPGGQTLAGDYRRYSFSYVAPAGDWQAGQTIEMQFVRRLGVRVKIGGTESLWLPCPPGTS